MNPRMLIASCPNVNSKEEMAQWFAKCEKWATDNDSSLILKDSRNGLFFISDDTIRQDARTTILARIKAEAKR